LLGAFVLALRLRFISSGDPLQHRARQQPQLPARVGVAPILRGFVPLLTAAIGRHPCCHAPPVEEADLKLLIYIIVRNRFEYLPDCLRSEANHGASSRWGKFLCRSLKTSILTTRRLPCSGLNEVSGKRIPSCRDPHYVSCSKNTGSAYAVASAAPAASS
jgi:hypothetical protein